MLKSLKIGILGGGQFGRKLLSYALQSGLNVSLLEKDVNVPWARHKSFFRDGDIMKYEDVFEFGEHLDMLAVFNDGANIDALKQLEHKGVKIYPSPETIEIIQDKYLQKQLLRENNIPIITGWIVSNSADTDLFATNTLEYNEKKTLMRAAQDQIAVQTWENLPCELEVTDMRESTHTPKRELLVTVSRNEEGIVECYDPAVMILNRGRMFVDFEICPSGLDREMSLKACEIAANVAESIKLKGLIIVEMILANNGRMYVNDLAIRPYKTTSHKLRPDVNSKTGQLMRLLLDLPEESAYTDESCSKIAILEPAAYRKHVIEQAINTILCTNDIHLQYDHNSMNISTAQPLTINEHIIEEKLSKAIMIQHLLKVD